MSIIWKSLNKIGKIDRLIKHGFADELLNKDHDNFWLDVFCKCKM